MRDKALYGRVRNTADVLSSQIPDDPKTFGWKLWWWFMYEWRTMAFV